LREKKGGGKKEAGIQGNGFVPTKERETQWGREERRKTSQSPHYTLRRGNILFQYPVDGKY